jgi:HSP90 family molecular chaperone
MCATFQERHSKEVTYITSASVTEIKRSPTVEVTYRQGEKLLWLRKNTVFADLFWLFI